MPVACGIYSFSRVETSKTHFVGMRGVVTSCSVRDSFLKLTGTRNATADDQYNIPCHLSALYLLDVNPEQFLYLPKAHIREELSNIKISSSV